MDTIRTVARPCQALYMLMNASKESLLMTNNELAKALGCTPRTIQRQLSELKKTNLISITVKRNNREIVLTNENLYTGYPQNDLKGKQENEVDTESVSPPTTSVSPLEGPTPLLTYVCNNIHKNTDAKNECQENVCMSFLDTDVKTHNESMVLNQAAGEMLEFGIDPHFAKQYIDESKFSCEQVLDELAKYRDDIDRLRKTKNSVAGYISHMIRGGIVYKTKTIPGKNAKQPVGRKMTEQERASMRIISDKNNAERLKSADEFEKWLGALTNEEKAEYGGEEKTFQRLKLRTYFGRHVKTP